MQISAKETVHFLRNMMGFMGMEGVQARGQGEVDCLTLGIACRKERCE